MAINGDPAGFWSYTHRDDEIEDGRIKRLAKKIANEFEGITAEELDVFLDKKDIKWGDEWRKRIDNALTGSTFFMPIVTPRFFKSEECRREILTFAGHAKSLGLEELLLPILYFDVPQLKDPNPGDEVMTLVAQRQYEDWTKLRLEDEDSPEYRKAVNRLAARLVEILERTAEVDPPPVVLADDADPEDEPGMLDLMADAEAALPSWANSMEQFGTTVREMGERVRLANEEMSASDARGGGFAGRLRITQSLAEDLKDPVDKLGRLGHQYSADLLAIDPGILGIIRLVETEDISGENEAQVVEFFNTIKTTAGQIRGMVNSVREFSSSLDGAASLSKTMRPLIKKMRASLQRVVDGQAVLDEWERRIDEVSRTIGGS
ncbi:toll/interleukin-1 receptor domain-containing protein [Streptomyces sp. enrichment culture]|uniref:toll/interleukin-1 receptor domain-containing protein n=1 Tax=Streptomyces sp. enrichment culture TaxID=1795815 RepID=UPI003F54E9AB